MCRSWDSLVSTGGDRAPFLLIGNFRSSASIRPLRRKSYRRLLPPYVVVDVVLFFFFLSCCCCCPKDPPRLLGATHDRRSARVASSSPDVDDRRHRRRLDHGRAIVIGGRRISRLVSSSSSSSRRSSPRALSFTPFPSTRRAPSDLSLHTNHESLREFSVTIHLSVKCVKGPPTPSTSYSVEGHYHLLAGLQPATRPALVYMHALQERFPPEAPVCSVRWAVFLADDSTRLLGRGQKPISEDEYAHLFASSTLEISPKSCFDVKHPKKYVGLHL